MGKFVSVCVCVCVQNVCVCQLTPSSVFLAAVCGQKSFKAESWVLGSDPPDLRCELEHLV